MHNPEDILQNLGAPTNPVAPSEEPATSPEHVAQPEKESNLERFFRAQSQEVDAILKKEKFGTYWKIAQDYPNIKDFYAEIEILFTEQNFNERADWALKYLNVHDILFLDRQGWQKNSTVGSYTRSKEALTTLQEKIAATPATSPEEEAAKTAALDHIKHALMGAEIMHAAHTKAGAWYKQLEKIPAELRRKSIQDTRQQAETEILPSYAPILVENWEKIQVLASKDDPHLLGLQKKLQPGLALQAALEGRSEEDDPALALMHILESLRTNDALIQAAAAFNAVRKDLGEKAFLLDRDGPEDTPHKLPDELNTAASAAYRFGEFFELFDKATKDPLGNIPEGLTLEQIREHGKELRETVENTQAIDDTVLLPIKEELLQASGYPDINDLLDALKKPKEDAEEKQAERVLLAQKIDSILNEHENTITEIVHQFSVVSDKAYASSEDPEALTTLFSTIQSDTLRKVLREKTISDRLFSVLELVNTLLADTPEHRERKIRKTTATLEAIVNEAELALPPEIATLLSENPKFNHESELSPTKLAILLDRLKPIENSLQATYAKVNDILTTTYSHAAFQANYYADEGTEDIVERIVEENRGKIKDIQQDLFTLSNLLRVAENSQVYPNIDPIVADLMVQYEQLTEEYKKAYQKNEAKLAPILSALAEVFPEDNLESLQWTEFALQYKKPLLQSTVTRTKEIQTALTPFQDNFEKISSEFNNIFLRWVNLRLFQVADDTYKDILIKTKVKTDAEKAAEPWRKTVVSLQSLFRSINEILERAKQEPIEPDPIADVDSIATEDLPNSTNSEKAPRTLEELKNIEQKIVALYPQDLLQIANNLGSPEQLEKTQALFNSLAYENAPLTGESVAIMVELYPLLQPFATYLEIPSQEIMDLFSDHFTLRHELNVEFPDTEDVVAIIHRQSTTLGNIFRTCESTFSPEVRRALLELAEADELYTPALQQLYTDSQNIDFTETPEGFSKETITFARRATQELQALTPSLPQRINQIIALSKNLNKIADALSKNLNKITDSKHDQDNELSASSLEEDLKKDNEELLNQLNALFYMGIKAKKISEASTQPDIQPDKPTTESPQRTGTNPIPSYERFKQAYTGKEKDLGRVLNPESVPETKETSQQRIQKLNNLAQIIGIPLEELRALVAELTTTQPDTQTGQNQLAEKQLNAAKELRDTLELAEAMKELTEKSAAIREEIGLDIPVLFKKLQPDKIKDLQSLITNEPEGEKQQAAGKRILDTLREVAPTLAGRNQRITELFEQLTNYLATISLETNEKTEKAQIKLMSQFHGAFVQLEDMQKAWELAQGLHTKSPEDYRSDLENLNYTVTTLSQSYGQKEAIIGQSIAIQNIPFPISQNLDPKNHTDDQVAIFEKGITFWDQVLQERDANVTEAQAIKGILGDSTNSLPTQEDSQLTPEDWATFNQQYQDLRQAAEAFDQEIAQASKAIEADRKNIQEAKEKLASIQAEKDTSAKTFNAIEQDFTKQLTPWLEYQAKMKEKFTDPSLEDLLDPETVTLLNFKDRKDQVAQARTLFQNDTTLDQVDVPLNQLQALTTRLETLKNSDTSSKAVLQNGEGLQGRISDLTSFLEECKEPQHHLQQVEAKIAELEAGTTTEFEKLYKEITDYDDATYEELARSAEKGDQGPWQRTLRSFTRSATPRMILGGTIAIASMVAPGANLALLALRATTSGLGAAASANAMVSQRLERAGRNKFENMPLGDMLKEAHKFTPAEFQARFLEYLQTTPDDASLAIRMGEISDAASHITQAAKQQGMTINDNQAAQEQAQIAEAEQQRNSSLVGSALGKLRNFFESGSKKAQAVKSLGIPTTISLVGAALGPVGIVSSLIINGVIAHSRSKTKAELNRTSHELSSAVQGAQDALKQFVTENPDKAQILRDAQVQSSQWREGGERKKNLITAGAGVGFAAVTTALGLWNMQNHGASTPNRQIEQTAQNRPLPSNQTTTEALPPKGSTPPLQGQRTPITPDNNQRLTSTPLRQGVERNNPTATLHLQLDRLKPGQILYNEESGANVRLAREIIRAAGSHEDSPFHYPVLKADDFQDHPEFEDAVQLLAQKLKTEHPDFFDANGAIIKSTANLEYRFTHEIHALDDAKEVFEQMHVQPTSELEFVELSDQTPVFPTESSSSAGSSNNPVPFGGSENNFFTNRAQEVLATLPRPRDIAPNLVQEIDTITKDFVNKNPKLDDLNLFIKALQGRIDGKPVNELPYLQQYSLRRSGFSPFLDQHPEAQPTVLQHVTNLEKALFSSGYRF